MKASLTSAAGPVETNAPHDATDDYGAVFTLTPPDLSSPLTVTIRNGGTVDVDAQTLTPTETPTAWFQPGEQVVHRSRGAAEDFATIHYRRPAADYGDPTSADFEDFWGLHVWTGAATETAWDSPLRPIGQDDQLAYILHRGDTKDPGPDQFLVFDTYGHEVWQPEGADPEKPYVAPPAAMAAGP